MSDRWAAISVPLRPEAIDDVSTALGRLVGRNLALETRPRPPDADWPVTAHAYIAPGVEQDASRREVLRTLEFLRLAGAGTVGAASAEYVDADAYETRWRDFLAPLAIGRRLVVIPAWFEQPAVPSGRIPVYLDSAMAFGTGHHPTTRLTLEAMEESIEAGDVVVDVGTGSGVLAIAAAKLGAARVYALDRDPETGAAAAANVRRNGVSRRIKLNIPSSGVLAPEPATLVVANIVASVHLELMDAYAGLLQSPGRLMLGGVVEPRVDDVITAARDCGFSLRSTAADGEWRLLDFAMLG